MLLLGVMLLDTATDYINRISQIAYHTPEPLFTEPEFLIVIWAILLATIIGPIGAGWVIKRWKQDVLKGGWD